jgi:putative drug exporter of the RND superfamily
VAMLLIVYRSIGTTMIMLFMVLIELAVTRGVVAALANTGIVGLSTYATNLITLLAIAAGTDYAIFLVGRYQEARSDGLDREAAYYAMFRGTVHVIVGSGLTISGAVACLMFTRLPYFYTLGAPAAVGVLVTLSAALTLGPAAVVIGSWMGRLEPRHKKGRTNGWRRVGTAIVRGLTRRAARPARVQNRLRYAALLARVIAGQRRLCRCRTALLGGPAQPRTADGRNRSRHA